MLPLFGSTHFSGGEMQENEADHDFSKQELFIARQIVLDAKDVLNRLDVKNTNAQVLIPRILLLNQTFVGGSLSKRSMDAYKASIDKELNEAVSNLDNALDSDISIDGDWCGLQTSIYVKYLLTDSSFCHSFGWSHIVGLANEEDLKFHSPQLSEQDIQLGRNVISFVEFLVLGSVLKVMYPRASESWRTDIVNNVIAKKFAKQRFEEILYATKSE